jgi:hypothetical protein
MNPSRSNRRSHKPTLATERLEDRQMLTGGVGSTFAIIPATISKAGGTVSVPFNLDPSLFTDPKNRSFTLGLDIAANSGSTANPEVVSITTPTGKVIPVTHTAFDSKVKRSGDLATSKITTAALVTIPGLKQAGTKSDTYKVNVKGMQNTSGGVLVGFYLPGDADGNGTVQTADINAIKYELNDDATNSKYTFDADVNRNGVVDSSDLKLATSNLGIGTTISPVISANVAPSMMTDPTTNTTNLSNITVTGAATPGATITFSETGEPATTATATSTGTYSINLPLLTGSNTYSVSTSDAFGQTITGAINAITYNPNATVPTETTSTSTSTTSSTTTSG